MKKEKIKKVVKKEYAKIARNGNTCCIPANSCCGTTDLAESISKNIGYTNEELYSVPKGANLGLGCGNPVALASLRKGETVLDLGSGAGFDCFLAANKVGENGKVIGIDMTPEMIQKARKNAIKGNYKNVEFRLGEIERIPVVDNSVDVVISNCVINLSPDKKRVFTEVFKVLKLGGRMFVSDIVLLKELPNVIKKSVKAYISCLSGAIMKDEYLKAIKIAGFKNIRIIDETNYPIELMANDPTARTIIKNLKIPINIIKNIADSVVSIKIQGVKGNNGKIK